MSAEAPTFHFDEEEFRLTLGRTITALEEVKIAGREPFLVVTSKGTREANPVTADDIKADIESIWGRVYPELFANNPPAGE